jgi:hypothetical protein
MATSAANDNDGGYATAVRHALSVLDGARALYEGSRACAR